MSGRKGITPKLWDAVMYRDFESCHYCGFPAIEVDHVIPVSRGGGNDLENLVAACWECNHEKLDLTPDEWADKRRQAGNTWPVVDYAERMRVINGDGDLDQMKHIYEMIMNGGYEYIRSALVAARNGTDYLIGYERLWKNPQKVSRAPQS